MSDERPPDDPDDRADGATDPTASSDDAPADVPDDASDRQEADGGYSEEREPPEQRDRDPERDRDRGRESGTKSESEPDPGEPQATGSATGGLSDRVAFWISALIGLVLAVGSVALVSGRAPFFEDILRIRPTVEGGGIGADWVVGNTDPILDALIALVHLADVVMGIFILLMVFIHWAAFRRLGARMQPPGGTRTRETATATDGGVSESDDDATADRPGGDRP